MSVTVSKLQVTVLALSSRDISETVRIDCHSFVSCLRISVWPINFFMGGKNKKRVQKPSHHANIQLIASDPSKCLDFTY